MEKTPQNMAPVTGQPTVKTKDIFTIVILSVLAISVFTWGSFRFMGDRNGKKVNDNRPAAVSRFGSMEARRVLISNFGKLIFPKIEIESPAPNNSLPGEISELINPKAQNTTIKEVTFNSGKKGFRVTYTYPGWSSNSFGQKMVRLDQDKYWQILVSQRSDNFAFADLEGAHYEVRLVSSQISDNLTGETIIAIGK